MNDNDIIEALDCCCDRRCGECVRLRSGHREVWVCSHEMMGLALALINRQKAEIERLYKSLNLTQQEQYINGRNDGIKEFAERMKASLDGKTDPVDEYDIDELVKKMTEGEDGNV